VLARDSAAMYEHAVTSAATAEAAEVVARAIRNAVIAANGL
jgi:hypothetical protein